MKAVTVDTTAGGIQICAAGDRDFLHIQNNGATDIFVKYDGSATALTAANGVKVAAGEWLVLNNDGTRKIFNKEVRGITSAGSSDVRVMGTD